jgi:hypothetical protein
MTEAAVSAHGYNFGKKICVNLWLNLTDKFVLASSGRQIAAATALRNYSNS